jgi:hypothetical protein
VQYGLVDGFIVVGGPGVALCVNKISRREFNMASDLHSKIVDHHKI